MTKKLLFSLLICCVATLCLSAAASELPITATEDTLSVEDKMAAYFQDINAFNRMYPQEKVYLH
ncbi:MAG: hypothetical protein IIX29_07100, partial [Bacteroidales bacterium]|nr:hypothetical protein [Bacteroidales bacterium]